MRRDVPEENAETLTIRIVATPSFASFERMALGPLAAVQPWMAAWTAWSRMAEAAWRPWFQALGAPAAPPAGRRREGR
jgi:hypothetical protein